MLSLSKENARSHENKTYARKGGKIHLICLGLVQSFIHLIKAHPTFVISFFSLTIKNTFKLTKMQMYLKCT